LKLDDLLKTAISRVETVHVVRTALNPLLWLDGIALTLALAAAIWITDPLLRDAFFVLAALGVLATIIAYFVLLFRDPDRLQSEEYRLRQSALQLLIAKGGDEKIVDAATQIARVENLLGGFGDGEEK
jgi:hypothetical protein